MIKRPNIAIIRGSSLNSWEMQNYAPLTDAFNISVISPLHTNYDTDLINLPILKTWTLSDIYHYSNRLRPPTRLTSEFNPLKRLNSDRFLGLKRILKNADLVHTVGIFQIFNQQLAQLKDKLGYKLISTMWENIPFLWDSVGSNSTKVHQRKQLSLQAIDHYLAISQRAKATLMLEGVPEEKITVQPMGIDTHRFIPTTKDKTLLNQLGLTDKNFIILFVGRLDGKKGARELVFAAARLKQQRLANKYQLRFIIVGKGNYRATVDTLVQRTNTKDIIKIISHFPYQDMPKVHNLADIFYLGSTPTEVWQEQFGMVLVESMACGKPIIVAESGSIPEVVGDAAVLFPPGDFYRLSEELTRLIKDQRRRNSLGQEGRQRAETHFSSQKVAGKIGEIYRQLLQKKGKHWTHNEL